MSVAGNARNAQPARNILVKFGIGINDARNGVFLPIGGDETLLLDKAIAFHEPMVRDVPFFRLVYRNSPIYVNESFIQRVREAELVGLDFFLAWSPEGGPPVEGPR